jgi:hypothetical protein
VGRITNHPLVAFDAAEVQVFVVNLWGFETGGKSTPDSKAAATIFRVSKGRKASLSSAR